MFTSYPLRSSQDGLLPSWKLRKKPGTLRNRFENRVVPSVFNCDLDIAEVIPRFFSKAEFEIVVLSYLTKCFAFVQANPAAQIGNSIMRFCFRQRNGKLRSQSYRHQS